MNERKFYDIHTHIIPGVDDGSQNIEETREMLKIADSEGIHTIVATPHFIAGRSCSKEKVIERFHLLVDEAKKISEDFCIYLGNELYYSSDIVEDLKEQNAFTMAESKYVLVEFSVMETYRNLKEGIQEIMMSGYRPILAHVERYQCMREIGHVSELVDAGCYMQVNATSFLGNFFDKQSKYCKKLMGFGYVHLIGSDCHNIEHRRPMMKQTYLYLQKYFNRDSLDEIFFTNPRKVINNEWI